MKLMDKEDSFGLVIRKLAVENTQVVEGVQYLAII